MLQLSPFSFFTLLQIILDISIFNSTNNLPVIKHSLGISISIKYYYSLIILSVSFFHDLKLNCIRKNYRKYRKESIT